MPEHVDQQQQPPVMTAPPPAASVWVVTSYRAGERAQVLALAEALGWPFRVIELEYRRSASRISLFRARSLAGISPGHVSLLAPPWPSLVISAGMRNEPVCRWIRDQSGGRTRLVHIGRPWAPLEEFDLVITTPQYRLPERPNVLQNNLTLHRVTPERLRSEADRWRPRLEGLPRPWFAVIVGGSSGPGTFGPRAARRLAAGARTMAMTQGGGTLLVSTSARTAVAAEQAMAESIGKPVHFYHWRQNDGDNPYFGYLALADAIIVTSDSIAMLTEACATGKPVYMFDLAGQGRDESDFRLSGQFYRWMMRWGPQRLSRDISLVHRKLLDTGRAVWLGESFSEQGAVPPDDLDRAVAGVRALFADDRRQ